MVYSAIVFSEIFLRFEKKKSDNASSKLDMMFLPIWIDVLDIFRGFAQLLM